jgi:hypothetical protein
VLTIAIPQRLSPQNSHHAFPGHDDKNVHGCGGSLLPRERAGDGRERRCGDQVATDIFGVVMFDTSFEKEVLFEPRLMMLRRCNLGVNEKFRSNAINRRKQTLTIVWQRNTESVLRAGGIRTIAVILR